VKRLSADDSADTCVKVGHRQTPHNEAQLEKSSWALCFARGSHFAVILQRTALRTTTSPA
ncbi:hypothetical protein, partial [Vogesella indigofera]|uniref:hypothetical protein n=1 Tax=Vogesella indigofera TaxID=45465 RepID=UPI00234E7EDC